MSDDKTTKPGDPTKPADAADPKAPERAQTGIAPEPRTREEQEEAIDEASEDSFPASDPPSFTVTTKASD